MAEVSNTYYIRELSLSKKQKNEREKAKGGTHEVVTGNSCFSKGPDPAVTNSNFSQMQDTG